MKVKVGVSARHIHISKEDLKFLFCDNYKLEKERELSCKGEYASKATLTIKTNKGTIENVRIIGPLREYTQVEVSKSDAYKLGINPPIRLSGDLKNSESITLCHNDKELKKSNVCIISKRHIHMSTKDAFKLGFKDNEIVKVKIKGEKGGILDNVCIRIKDNYVLELHIDLDDANAHLISNNDFCEVINNE